ncbi:DUF551 domain-containing protein [Klebsiella pneumoniae]|uniref:DUF551 domain-containing protein n=1 Tax=Klebsiella pneumoniae TaxID=573 RepID=UPI001C673EBF|nr:DUF551 domain-containing protein [Klebsiella pneumoniae]MBW6044241.1 hypothetical protein [Klebsiella pneumoniae]
MTSKLTRERLEKIKSWRETYGAGSNVMLPAEEAEELASIALAAMDSEPVAWTWQHLKQWHVTNDEARARDLAWDGVKVEPLYRHAQSAPVVPEEKSIPNTLSMCAVDAVAAIAEVKGWNACRAATLQASNCRENSNSSTNNFREMLGTSTNSPVIPDTWIPVSERMPEVGGDMIVFTDGIVMSGVSYAKKKGFYIQAIEYDDDEPVDSVTHWMPLPAAPQEPKP